MNFCRRAAAASPCPARSKWPGLMTLNSTSVWREPRARRATTAMASTSRAGTGRRRGSTAWRSELGELLEDLVLAGDGHLELAAHRGNGINQHDRVGIDKASGGAGALHEPEIDVSSRAPPACPRATSRRLCSRW